MISYTYLEQAFVLKIRTPILRGSLLHSSLKPESKKKHKQYLTLNIIMDIALLCCLRRTAVGIFNA
jgi:hypothetical protein